MATSDMYKNSYTGKDNYIYLNDSKSAAKYPGASIFANGTAYTSDGTNWDATTTASYTSSTLPDPAMLGDGAYAIVGGIPVQVKDGKFLGEYTVGSGIPFVVPSSGNITSASGNVTVTSAFNYIIGPSYTFFPQGALFAKSPAGLVS